MDAPPADWLERVAESLCAHEDRRDTLLSFPPRYEVLDELSRGGMGIVYRAWDPQLGRNVALKVLRSEDGSAEAEAHERFQREARLAASLHHPNIVPIYDTGTWNGQDYIAMQLIEGRTLDRAKPDRRQALAFIRDAARALQHAHEQGIVHRDIKPSNLMVDGQGRVFVADFGIARHAVATAGMTSPGTVVGTPAYMSPEQAQGLPADARSDVYSLGATLYELLTGRAPYTGEAVDVVDAVRTKDPDSARRLVTDLSKNVEAILSGAMERRPQDRYPTAAALADDIERYLAGERPLRRPRGLSYKVRREFVRHPWRSAASIVFCLLLLGAGVVLGFFIRSLMYLRIAEKEPDLQSRKEDLQIAAVFFPKKAALGLARVKTEEDDLAERSKAEELKLALAVQERTQKEKTEKERLESEKTLSESKRQSEEDKRRADIAQLELSALGSLEDRNLEEASKTIDRLLTLAPEKRPGWTSKLRKAEFEVAIARLSEAVSAADSAAFDALLTRLKGPDYASQKDRNLRLSKIVLQRAIRLAELRRPREAVLLFDDAEVLGYREALLYERRGVAQIELEDFQAADRDLNSLMQRTPSGTRYPAPFAEIRYRQGHLALIEKNWARAFEQFEIALYINHNHARALHDRGLARFFSVGQPKEVLEEDLESALNVDPALLPDPAYRDVVVAYARSQGAEVWKAEAAGDRHAAWKRALHWISLIEEKTSGNDALRMEDARMRRRLNDYDAALSRLSGLRDTPELLRLRGQIRFEKAFERTKDPEQLKAALTDFDAAVRMNPGGALELFWRGTCQHALTDTARAMEDLQASRKLGLDSPDLHYQLSKLQLGLKAFPLAAEQAGAALGQSDSLTEEGYVANLFEQRGLSRSAGIRLLECEVLLCRASAEFALSDYKACSRDCTRILGSDPQNLKAFILRGEAACRDNRHADAQKDFEMAVTVASSEKEKVDATQRRESCLGHSK